MPIIQKAGNVRIFYPIVISFFVRILFAIGTSTNFVPDEYYQCMEPAYKKISGYGITTWEWKNEYMIRSFVGLLHTVFFYHSACILGLSNSIDIMVRLPRISFAVISSIADVAYFLTIRDIFKDETMAMKYFCVHLFSWSSLYCMSRTLANSYETALYMCSTYLLNDCIDSDQPKFSNILGFILALISCYTRPSGILLFVPLIFNSLSLSKKQSWSNIMTILACCLSTLSICLMIDFYYYDNHSIVIPPLNFFTVNIVQNIASLYGVNTWHWNFSQGLPVMLGLYTLIVIYGIYRIRDFWIAMPHQIRFQLFVAVFYAVGLSLISPHQEFRFLLPCLPGFHLFISFIVFGNPNPASSPTFTEGSSLLSLDINNNIRKREFLMALLFVIHFLFAAFMSTYHQGGAEKAAIFSAKFIQSRIPFLTVQQNKAPINIHLLGPCHSFPGYSYFHAGMKDVKIKLHFPDCSPRTLISNNTESQMMTTNPLNFYSFVKKNETSSCQKIEFSATCNETSQMSSHGFPIWGEADMLLTFDAYLEKNLREAMQSDGLVQVASFEHALFRYDYDDPDFRSIVFVFAKKELIDLGGE